MVNINFIVLGLILATALYTDLKSNKIPNILTGSGLAIGLIYHFIYKGLIGLSYSILGALVGLILFLILYLFKAVGAGDVKLFAAIGALTGMEFVLYSSMYAILYAGLIGIFILLFKKEFFKQTFKLFRFNNAYRFPFMLAVVPGVLTTYYYFFLV